MKKRPVKRARWELTACFFKSLIKKYPENMCKKKGNKWATGGDNEYRE